MCVEDATRWFARVRFCRVTLTSGHMDSMGSVSSEGALCTGVKSTGHATLEMYGKHY